MGAPILTVDDLRVDFELPGRTVHAVRGVSFEVRAGRTLAIVGESGSGKSTTARVLAGVTPATSGRIDILGTEVTGLGRRAYRPLRRCIQVVYQNP